MTEQEFKEIIGKDLVVDYPFFDELQKWDMRNFYVDEKGEIKHNRVDLIIKNFIKGARNPHKGKATHG